MSGWTWRPGERDGADSDQLVWLEVNAVSDHIDAMRVLRLWSFLAALAVGIPTALLIGKDGREVARAVGPIDWDSEEAISMIGRVLYPAP